MQGDDLHHLPTGHLERVSKVARAWQAMKSSKFRGCLHVAGWIGCSILLGVAFLVACHVGSFALAPIFGGMAFLSLVFAGDTFKQIFPL